MTRIPGPGRGLVRCLSLAAAAMLVLSVAAGQRAEALSLINAGAVPAAKQVSDELMTEVKGGTAAAVAMVAAVSTAAVASMAVVVSMAAARHFTVAASVAAARRFMAAGFGPPMFSTAVVFAMAGSRSGIITGTSFTTGASMDHPIITDRPIIITRTAAATPSGPLTARAASVTIATGAITGIIAGITRGELRPMAETNQAPDGRLIVSAANARCRL
jgi:hypothetical protein